MSARVWANGDGGGGERSRPLGEALAGLARAMSCVDAAFVLGPEGGSLGAEAHDAETLAVVEACLAFDGGGDRGGDGRALLPFVGIDLLAGDAPARVRAWVDRGAAGITISPADQGVRPTDDRCGRVLESAAAADVPVVVTNPGLDRRGLGGARGVLSFADPALFDEAAMQIRGLRLVLSEFGRFATDGALMMLARHAGVFADTSWLGDRPMESWRVLGSAHERGVLDKLLFGSGYPRVAPQRAISGLYSMQAWASRTMDAPIPREALRSIVERDALGSLRMGVDGMVTRGARLRAGEGSGAGSGGGDVVSSRRARRALPMHGPSVSGRDGRGGGGAGGSGGASWGGWE